MKKKLVVAITGASGSLYAQRLLHYLNQTPVEVSLVFSKNARTVWEWELGTAPNFNYKSYAPNDYFAPFASGSARYEAMVILPASMGTIARIAHGISDNLITRAADVFLKEQRKLILVFRELPLSVVHLENLLSLARAGATIIPAAPSFYHRPKDINALVDTVIFRVLDHLHIPLDKIPRWSENA